ncbi:hypothetical protein MKW94_005115 [Papaver nudicaule]|uniref:Uncharacterized protein n=1 Tax=Papaver nudicaule TaxID=74823 RepID=A0AA41VKA3_PAPNU|nr:hypothetical protein [Papaver nudicaule]
MVAISLYRGNLHKAPDAPRKWLMPRRNISLKDFRLLSRKRDKTLSTKITTSLTDTAIVPVPNPKNPNLYTNPNPNLENLIEVKEDEEEVKQHPTGVDDAQCHIAKEEVDELVLSVDVKSEELLETDPGLKNGVDGTSQEQPTTPNVCINVDLPTEKEKKKRELEEKLEVLNGRKHNLVQMLKQILNAEEEMKRRNNALASGIRPPAPLQVETSDLGSPRQAVTRAGLEANHCGDLEGESEDHSPQNAHVRHFQRMRSTSPSGSSPRRKSSHSSFQPSAQNPQSPKTHGISSFCCSYSVASQVSYTLCQWFLSFSQNPSFKTQQNKIYHGRTWEDQTGNKRQGEVRTNGWRRRRKGYRRTNICDF